MHGVAVALRLLQHLDATLPPSLASRPIIRIGNKLLHT